jgi:predicted nucleic acid-binding protein
MPSPVYLLDTNVVLHLVRGNAVGKELADAFGLLNSVNRPLVSIVTHGELFLLAARNNWGAEKRTVLENALDNLVTVDLNDKAVLSAYVEVQQYSRRAPADRANSMLMMPGSPLARRRRMRRCLRPTAISAI